MRERRRGEPERLVQQNLPRRVRDVVLASDDMRHFHQGIVDDDREVVRGMSVSAHDDRIADDFRVEPHLAAHEVGEDHFLVGRDAKADGGMLAGVDARLCVLGAEVAAGPLILGRPAGGERLLALGLELLAGAEAVICLPARQQLLRVRLIEM